MKVTWQNPQLTKARVEKDGKYADVYLYGEGCNWYYQAAGFNATGPIVEMSIQDELERRRKKAEAFWHSLDEPEPAEAQPLPVAKLRRKPWWRFWA